MDKTLEEQLKQVAFMISNDGNLNEETRNSLLELVAAVNREPSGGNLEALSIVLDKLADATRYNSALRTMKTIEAKSQEATI